MSHGRRAGTALRDPQERRRGAASARLREALRSAFEDPALARAREDLLLDGIELLPPAAYARIAAFARFAARHDYPALR